MQNPFRRDTDMDEQMCGGFQLSRTERFTAFGILFAFGFLLSFLSTFLLMSLKLTAFASLYSLGNVVSLVATGFLVGFQTQLKNMFDSSRRTATIVFLSTWALTVFSAFVLKSGFLTIIFCIAQYFALMWYSLSYIPFARDAVKAFFNRFI